MRRRHILLTAVVVAGAVPQIAHAGWRAPVGGPVTSAFDYRRSTPFERGAKRGVTLAAGAGDTVRAACSGRVTFAGPSPRGNVVTVRCGELVATHLGLASARVASGALVRGGRVIGAAGAHGVGLGARRAGDRWGYIDPIALIEPFGPGLGPAPTVRRQVPPEPAPALRPSPAARPAEAAREPPIVAWVGLALVAATLGGTLGGTVRRRWGPSTSRRRSTTSMPRRT